MCDITIVISVNRTQKKLHILDGFCSDFDVNQILFVY